MSGQARALTPGELAAILNPYAIQKGFKVAALSDNDPDGPCDVLHAVYEGHEQVSENEWEPSVELVELRDTDDYDDFLLGVIAALAAELARAQAGAQAVAGLEVEWRRKSRDCSTAAGQVVYGSTSRAGFTGKGTTYKECADDLHAAFAQISEREE